MGISFLLKDFALMKRRYTRTYVMPERSRASSTGERLNDAIQLYFDYEINCKANVGVKGKDLS